MFYYKLFVFFSIVTIGVSISIRESSSNQPERCCEPKQYSSKISITIGTLLPDGKTSIFYGRFNYSLDQTRGIAGMKGISYSIPDGQPTKLQIIENLNDGQTYVIIVDIKQCSKSIFPIQPTTCIPESAIYIDSTMYGYGDKQIIGDTWLSKINETISYTTVSRGDCVLLTASTFTEQQGMVNELIMTDFVPRIIDPDIFDIPPECQKLI